MRIALVLAAVYGALLNGGPRPHHGAKHDVERAQCGADPGAKAIIAKQTRAGSVVECRRSSGSPDDVPLACLSLARVARLASEHAILVTCLAQSERLPRARRCRSALSRAPPAAQS